MSLLALWGHYLGPFLRGTLVTLQITGISLAVSLVLGFVVSLARMSAHRTLRSATAFFIEVVRATPVLVLLFVAFYSLAQLGVTLAPLVAAVAAFGLFYTTLYAEIFRSGIESVGTGQREAAAALGMTNRAILFKVVLPQAVVAVLPPATNAATDLIKDTSLVVTIGVGDLMYQAYAGASATFLPMDMFALAGIFYFVICYALSILLRRWEVSYAQRLSARG